MEESAKSRQTSGFRRFLFCKDMNSVILEPDRNEDPDEDDPFE